MGGGQSFEGPAGAGRAGGSFLFRRPDRVLCRAQARFTGWLPFDSRRGRRPAAGGNRHWPRWRHRTASGRPWRAKPRFFSRCAGRAGSGLSRSADPVAPFDEPTFVCLRVGAGGLAPSPLRQVEPPVVRVLGGTQVVSARELDGGRRGVGRGGPLGDGADRGRRTAGTFRRPRLPPRSAATIPCGPLPLNADGHSLLGPAVDRRDALHPGDGAWPTPDGDGVGIRRGLADRRRSLRVGGRVWKTCGLGSAAGALRRAVFGGLFGLGLRRLVGGPVWFLSYLYLYS